MFLALYGCMECEAQGLTAEGADSLYETFVDSRFGDPTADLGKLLRLERFFSEQRDTCRLARISSWKSNSYDSLGKLDSSMACAHLALRFFGPSCDSITLMSINANLTSTYLSLEEYHKVIELADHSLSLWNPAWGRSKSRKAFYTNKAIALVQLGQYELGLEAFLDQLRVARKDRNEADEMDACNNVAAMYGILFENRDRPAYLDSSEQYMVLALDIGKRLERREEVVIHYLNLANIARDRGQFEKCLANLDSAALYSDHQFLQLETTLASIRSDAFVGLGELDSALSALHVHIALKDSLLSSDKQKAISEMQEKYEGEKKERQIRELEVDNLNAALRQEQLTRTRNIYLFSGIGILLVAGGLWSRLRFTRKAKAAIQLEKDRSDELLLNILPEEVAEELKEKGAADAKRIDQATVLFTDFKGFTAYSENMSPEQLVKDLHLSFTAFDEIIAKHRMEKIKTIGDAYMAAGGLPVPNETHAVDVVSAALEIRRFIAEGKARKRAAGQPYFEIRIGIHTGPVVAGIVGVKKFSYDIWGDTVNTASRMESSCEVGQVNISEATYELVKNEPGLTFVPRGKIEAKGKGEMEMFFVEKRSDPS